MEMRIRRRPENKTSKCVGVERLPLRQSGFNEFLWVADIGGEEEVEWGSIFDLCGEIPTGAEGDGKRLARLRFVARGKIFHCELQIGGGRNAQLLGAGAGHKKESCRDGQTDGQSTGAKTKRRWRKKWHANSHGPPYTRRIMTSVDLMRAAARSPTFRRISLAASAVMMEVMCCSPMDRVI